MKDKKFIKINNHRVLISSIKRYIVFGDKNIAIRFSISDMKPNSETFSFANTEERDLIINELDSLLL